MTQLQKLQDIIRQRPGLAWDTTQYDKLSANAVVEHVMAYGDWEEFKIVEKTLGLKKLKEIFDDLTNKARVNLRPETVNLFSKYLQKHA